MNRISADFAGLGNIDAIEIHRRQFALPTSGFSDSWSVPNGSMTPATCGMR